MPGDQTFETGKITAQKDDAAKRAFENLSKLTREVDPLVLGALVDNPDDLDTICSQHGGLEGIPNIVSSLQEMGYGTNIIHAVMAGIPGDVALPEGKMLALPEKPE